MWRPLTVLACLASLALARPPKTNKDFSKMSEKDWDRISEEWEDEEERAEYEYKPPERKGIDMEKLQKAKGQQLQDIIDEAQAPAGPTMMFATIDYPGCCDKKKTEEIGTNWASMLRASGMDIQTYVIEDNQVLFSSNAGPHAAEIKNYVLTQPECVAVDWNSKRTPGPAETEEWKAKDEVKKEAAKKKADEKKAAEAAAKAPTKKRKKAKKKAKAAGKDEV